MVKGDISSARSAAVSDCLNAAVDTAVLAILPREALVRHFKAAGEALAGDSSRFIQEYKVFTETLIGSEYRVFIEAVVRMDRVRQHLFDAGIAEVRGKLPKVLLLIAEPPRTGGDPVFGWQAAAEGNPPFSEAGIYEVMTEKGHPVVRPSVEIPIFPDILTDGRTDLSDADALELGRRLEVEVVVFGKGVIEPGIEPSADAGYSRKGTVTVRALRVDIGEEIGSVLESFTAQNPEDAKAQTEALLGAGRLAGAAVSDSIARQFAQKDHTAVLISLVVSGTHRLGNFVAFRRALVALPGVKKMQIEEIRAEEAVIRVAFLGTAQALANAIAATVFETFEVLVLETTPEQILLALSHREQDPVLIPSQTE